MISSLCHFVFSVQYTIWRECSTAGKFGKIGKSPAICQTLTSQILAYKWYPYMAKIYPFAKHCFANYF